MNLAKHFLFLVFDDPVVLGACEFLSSTLQRKARVEKPHLTIQGPYEKSASRAKILSIEETLRDDLFVIDKPGVFETTRGAALYLSVQSENLRSVWDKPDFPIERYGFNPHITLYDGPDVDRVWRAHEYLSRQNLTLFCRKFHLEQYVQKQSDMFPIMSVEIDPDAIGRMLARGNLGSSFRSGFMAYVNS